MAKQPVADLSDSAEWRPRHPDIPRPNRGDVYEAESRSGGVFRFRVYDKFSGRDAEGKSVLMMSGFTVGFPDAEDWDCTGCGFHHKQVPPEFTCGECGASRPPRAVLGEGGGSKLLMVLAHEVTRRISESTERA